MRFNSIFDVLERLVRRFCWFVLIPMIALLLAVQVTRQINRAMQSGDPEAFERHLKAAGGAWEKGDKDHSLAEMDAAAEVAPNSAKAHDVLAIVFKQFGRTRQALEHQEKATRLKGPPTLKDLHMLAEGYLDEHDIQNAKRLLDEDILVKWPESAEGQSLQGLILLADQNDADKRERAIVCFQRYLMARPDDQGIRFKLALCLSQAGKVEAAESELRSILAVDPDHWGAIHQLGEVLRLQGKQDEAEIFLSQHREIDAKLQRLRFLRTQRSLKQHTPEDLMELGALYMERKDYRKARDTFREYTRLRPKDPNGHQRSAEAYGKMGNEVEANYGSAIAQGLAQVTSSPSKSSLP